MTQQTAVEWLFEQICNLDWNHLQGEKKLEIFEQAKQMEKEQIIQAFDIACEDKDRIGKEYYYDTYGK